MSFNARVSYTANGNTGTFAITFSFIDSSHVKVFLDGVSTTAFSVSGSNVVMNSNPANGVVVLIKRETPTNARLVDFQDGSVLTESDLDKSADQNFFIAQEINDESQSAMKLDNSDRFDALNKRIINVADPTAGQDAVTKNYLENTFLTPSDKSNINTLAGISGLGSLASNQTNVNLVATNIANVNAVATDVTKIIEVANDLQEATSEIDVVANNITNVNAVGGAITNINTLASNITGVNSFAERYRVQAGVPSTSNDVGDLVFDTTANKLKVFDGSSYALAGSSVNGTSQRFKYVATASQTTFSGADANGNTLTYDVASGTAFADVYLNGVKLDTSDFTATDGSSIVLGSGASVNDILQVVAYGTFTLASFSASNLTSGTINNDRLPAPTLIVKGDGASVDGAIQLNCHVNTHGVKIKAPPHSAGQSYTLILPQNTGTNGQVLASNGSSTNQLSWIDATETKPTIADVSQTIAPATATTINITGTNFVSIPIVEFVKTDGSVTQANTISFTSATSLSVNVTLASGNYYVRVENPDGNAGRSTNNIITASTAPSFSTSAGSLGTFAGNFSGTLATISGSSDSAVTFSEVTSNLSGANVTLSSAGVLTTTDFGGSSTTPTTYNFTIRITDAEGQTADRAFSLTSSFGATGGGQFN